MLRTETNLVHGRSVPSSTRAQTRPLETSPPPAPRAAPAGEETLDLLAAAWPAVSKRHFGTPGARLPPALPMDFPLTGFDVSGVQWAARRFDRRMHRESADISVKVGRVSPSLHGVERDNRQFLVQLQARRSGLAELARLHGVRALPRDVDRSDVVLAQFTPVLLAEIRDQLLGHMDDAFFVNLRRNARKAGGALWQRLRGDDHALTRTRSQLIAEMLDLHNGGSALRRAVAELAPAMFRHAPIADMPALQRSDLVLRLATATIDQVMRPTEDEAKRAAELVVELGETLQQTFDHIHLDAMQRLTTAVARLPRGTQSTAVDALVTDAAADTGRRIDAARQHCFDEFRRRNGGEFGYNSLSEQVRENANVEFYKTLLVPGAAWAGAARLVTAALATAGGPAAVGLTVASTAVLQYATAVASQASAGATGAAVVDLRPYDSARLAKAQLDPQTYWNQRNMSKAVLKIGRQALHEYTRPGNPAAVQCRRQVQLLEQEKNYDHAARSALAPELLALAEYHDFMLDHDVGGLDQAIPPPIRIAGLLHAFADELPPLPRGVPVDAATREAVMLALVAAIERRSTKEPLADAATIVGRAHRHVGALVEASGLDRAALGAGLAPDAAAMHAGGVDFMALIQTMLHACGLTEQAMFESRGFLSAQYRGLLVNAVSGLAIQMLVGVAAFFGISAATAAGGPGAGFGAGVLFALASYALGSVSRDAGAVAWYRHDRKSQTDAQLYRALRLPDARPMVGDRERHVAAVEAAVRANHVPLHTRRMNQLFASVRAASETELIRGAGKQAQAGFDMLHALEQDPANTGGSRCVAQLAGLSLDFQHEAVAVQKHQAVIDIHTNSLRIVAATAESALDMLQTANEGIRETAQEFAQDRERYGIRGSYEYRRKHARFFPDDDGRVTAMDDLHRLRARTCQMLDAYLQRHATDPSFYLSRGELDSLATALRTPLADEASELWLARSELALAARGQLSEDDLAHHLAHSGLPADRVAAMRLRRGRLSGEIEEHSRAMRLLSRDLMALKAGRFDAIQDPLGIVGASIRSFSDAGQVSRFYRLNNDQAFIALVRGTGRFAGQVVPVTWRGAAAAAVTLAAGGLAIAQPTAHIGEFTLTAIGVDGMQHLKLSPKFGSLASPLASNVLNAVQPETNPITFQSSGQVQFLQGGFAPADPSFECLLKAGAADSEAFAELPLYWGEGPVPAAGILHLLHTNAGATQLKLQVDRRLKRPPDMALLSAADQRLWRNARAQSSRTATARLEALKPVNAWRSLTYARNARHHYDQIQNDRHLLAAGLASAGTSVASRF
jgi:hypothetical protein